MNETEATGKAAVDELLHFGVKGMKWGQRKEQAKAGARKVARGLGSLVTVAANSAWRGHVYSEEALASAHNEVASLLNGPTGHIAKLNASPKYRGKNLKTDHKLEIEYHQDVAKVSDAMYKKVAREKFGENFTGTQRAKFVNDVNGPRFEVEDIVVRHAASEKLVISFRVDETGHILEANKATSSGSMKQGEDFVGEVLSHHGVKGMRWGVRQKTPTVTVTDKKKRLKSKGGQGLPAHEDAVKAQVHRQKVKKSGTKALSNQELQELATRMNLEQQVSRLEKGQPKTAGNKFVKNFLAKQAKEHLPKLAKAAAAQQVAKAMESSAAKKEK